MVLRTEAVGMAAQVEPVQPFHGLYQARAGHARACGAQALQEHACVEVANEVVVVHFQAVLLHRGLEVTRDLHGGAQR